MTIKNEVYMATMAEIEAYGRPARIFGYPRSLDDVKGAVFAEMHRFEKLPQEVQPSAVRVMGKYVKMAFKVPYKQGNVPQDAIKAANKVGGYIMRACQGREFEPVFVPESISNRDLEALLG